ncbi:MAG: HEPN domain-containing protein [Alphaproteobacteria bacterium]
MNANAIPSIESIFFQANAFKLAAQKLTQPGPPNLLLMVAQIVNSSFSSELYLKCIIIIESGDSPHGHDLEKLFNQLKNETKNIIETRWNAERFQQWAILDEVDRLAGGPVNARTLRVALAREGKSFESWRYAHEPGKLPNFSLGSLPTILNAHILDIKPELQKF